MKKASIHGLVFVIFIAAGLVLTLRTIAPAQAPRLTISRIAIAGSVEGSSAAVIASSFPKRQETVFCYVELKDVPNDTTITFVWTYDQKEVGNVTQHVKKSKRWRTWSPKSPGGMKGEWKVEVLDETGTVLKSAKFTIG